ncbi:Protein transport protein [Triplophysa tibetana]|uniref:Protein transport protein sec16 n=1 Tax=Triplophysa tibetana TaxID=1572043 RepID=A0A5A9PCU9_9TELE|nr:Protein transport protein [Triplophysa tibetana]
MVVEKGGRDVQHGNLEQPPDNLETIYLPERRPSSRAQGARRPSESPATTLWAQNDPATLGANILLAPAAPLLAATFVPAHPEEVIQPPEDGPLDLHPAKPNPQLPSENLENPPDSQAGLGYASLLVATPPSSPANQLQPLFSQPLNPPSTQGVLNLAREAKDPPASIQAAQPALSRAQAVKGDSQSLPPSISQALPSSAASNHNTFSNYELLDFSMHQPQSINQVTGPAVSQSAQPPTLVNNTPGFYLQVTKDTQQGGQPDSEAQPLQQTSNPPRPSSNQVNNEPARYSHPAQFQPPPQVPPTHPGAPPAGPGSVPPLFTPPVWKLCTPAVPEPQRPPSVLSGQPGYGAPTAIPTGPGYAGITQGLIRSTRMGGYPIHPNTQWTRELRATTRSISIVEQILGMASMMVRIPLTEKLSVNQRDQVPELASTQTDPTPGRGIQKTILDPTVVPKMNTMQTTIRDNMMPMETGVGGMIQTLRMIRRYKAYYDQTYGWYNYDMDAYRRGEAYYNQQYSNRGVDDPWRYYPGYDNSFDDDYRRREQYPDDFDRASVHSEQSAHTVCIHHTVDAVASVHAHSRCVHSQVYRSQTDLVSAAYDATGTTLPVDYTYSQYPDPSEATNCSQIPYNPADGTWNAPEQPPPRPLTPEKFCIPHRCARFGPAGQLILVQPNLPSAGQPTLVEIHNIETILQDSPEQSEIRSFPGPLANVIMYTGRTHKVDVISLLRNKAQECLRNDDLIDKDSAYLIWEFIVLLCRQNGTVVGTDIADLLLKEHRSVWLPGKSPNEANLIDFNNEAIEHAEEEEAGPISLLSDTFMGDALEAAMKNGLWGHALLLASKMDNRTHARVMTRFANSLPINDPLQTVYQLMSGRMPAAATCCGDEKWGDWRPHLAMILSNLTHTLDLDTRTISTMGDTLASKGLVDAAHFCYLMAQVGFGVFTKKSTKMVLISSNHSLPFLKFCSTEAIQRTESYEYAQSLGSQPLSLPNFQVFKFIYACRLAELGLCAQAFLYCEVISRTLLTLPEYCSPVFTSQLIQMSVRLRFFDPQLKERPEQESFIEPDWLLHLRQLDGQIKEGVPYRAGRSTPQLYPCSSPSLEDQSSPPDPSTLTSDPHNQLMTSLVPTAGVQLMPPAPPTILQDGTAPQQQVPPPGESVPFYPVAPGPAQPNFVPPYQHEMQEQYMPIPPQMPPQMHPQMPPAYSPTEMNPLMPPQMPPPMPGQNLDPLSHLLNCSHSRLRHSVSLLSRGKTSTMRWLAWVRAEDLEPLHCHQCTTCATSESSNHSGRERSSSINQGSPPPPSIPESPHHEEPKKRDSPKKAASSGWLTWLYPKRKNEAHLPDDKNKSIVWDEKMKKWVNLEEPEEESKPPPPPPTSFPKAPNGWSGDAATICRGSRGGATRTKSRYVDVLNPSRRGSKPVANVPPPADLFAPLAPMAMPANLFTPAAALDEQPVEGSVPDAGSQDTQQTNAPVPQMFNPNTLPPGPEGTRSGEVPAQPPSQGAPPTGGVTFYNPSQFAQSVPASRTRPGRLGQRGYPTLK